MHISLTKSFNIPVSIALATLAHMINVYEICLNTKTLSDIQYAKFQILPVDLHFGLFWSAGHVTMNKLPDIWYCKIDGATIIVHLCVSRTDNLIPNTNIGYKLVYLWYMEPTHSATQKPACVSTHSATVSHSYNSLVHVYPIIDPCGII